jgi:hypothetical protein
MHALLIDMSIIGWEHGELEVKLGCRLAGQV